MKAIVYRQAGQFSVEEIPVPEPGPDQVVIQVKSCGICKTDVHVHQGDFSARFPLTTGHEFSGVVAAVGSQVADFAVGDRVTADNASLCGYCYYCRRDQPLYCENFYSLGVNGPGGLAEYVLVGHDKVFKIPDSLSFDQAAFTEPVSCAIHGMDRFGVQPGDQVLVFGAGPTGIILAQLLQAGGASDVLLAAPTAFKLEVAEALGVKQTLQISRTDYAGNEQLIKQRFPRGFDIIVEATGAVGIAEQCFRYTKKGSKVALYGVYDEDVTFPLNPYDIFSREISIIGSCAQTHCFPRALQYLSNGRVKVDHLITHHYGLDDYRTALDTVVSGRDSLKVMMHP
jgi:D-arabinitol dehydrogenase (NADP+)